MLTVRQDILQKWKTEIEHELNRFYGKIDKAYNEIEQLQIRKGIVDELCNDLQRRDRDADGYLFELQKNLEEKLKVLHEEMVQVQNDPKKVQLEMLMNRILEELPVLDEFNLDN
ncbi:hypothetical protein [Sutcliffiella cohnii]|uniref:hypothetical protein n=1 Tax=Sutcliffiella cohnii TaxID=33932 RepID=UPI002E21A64C|nr:hypothetical protein [Sutcliffiella cohnii]